MKIERFKTNFSYRKIVLAALFAFVLIGSFAMNATSQSKKFGATGTNSMGLKFQYPNQLELKEYEKQIGKKLSFSENPLFSKRSASGKLPPVTQRLPDEPLVVVPYSEIGKYGGTLKGTSLAMESGTSEILSWRQVNLVRMDGDNATVTPDVAKSWKWNKTYTQLTFRLRKGHKWSNGKPFTVDDVVFFINDIINNKKLNLEVPSSWMHNGKPITVKKIDSMRVAFIFSTPNFGFLKNLATGASYFTPYAAANVLKPLHIKYNRNANKVAKAAGYKSWVEYFKIHYHKWKDAVNATKFGLKVPTLESHILAESPNNQRRIFVANPYYFKVDTKGNQLPYIDRHHERFLDKELWVLEVLNGNINQKSQNVDIGNYPIFKENEKKGNFSLQLNPGQIGPVLIFNLTHKDPVLRKIYANVRFREAMSLALNRPELNEQLFLGLAKIEQALPIVSFTNEKDKQYMVRYDVKRANKLLDKMGLSKRGADGYRLRSDGKKVTVFWEYSLQFTRSAEFPLLIATYWRAVGINVLLKEVTTALVRQKEDQNDLDISMEWDLPFELNLINEPKIYTPPYSSSTPLVGIPWEEYWNSGGKIGMEPPKWAKRLRAIAKKWKTVVPGSKEYIKLGKEMVKINLENMVIIGSVGSLGQINVVSNRLGNVPQWGLNAYRTGFAFSYGTSQWFFK